jgi:phosphate transport system permease protein
VTYDEDILGVNDTSNASQMALGDFDGVVKAGLRNRFTEVTGRKNKQELYSIISSGAGYTIRDQLKETPSLLNSTVNLWLIADDDVDTYFKSLDDKNGPFRGRISENKESWLNSLIESGKVKTRFNSNFFSNGDSREPELAGIRGAAMGSFYTLLITIALAFPLGVAAAVYLEEFALRNRWTNFIEVNINNLAAVPSIIFGLLGLAVFINFFHVPRSVPLVGGLVLTLMTLPTINQYHRQYVRPP